MKIDIQVQEAQRVPNKINPKRSTPREVIIKMVKVKDKEIILKASGVRQLPTMGASIRCQLIPQTKLFNPEGISTIYSND